MTSIHRKIATDTAQAIEIALAQPDDGLLRLQELGERIESSRELLGAAATAKALQALESASEDHKAVRLREIADELTRSLRRVGLVAEIRVAKRRPPKKKPRRSPAAPQKATPASALEDSNATVNR